MNVQTRIIDASPTKDFFIHMLVKDIELTRAIVDLVDNCVDGALRIRPDGNYGGLEVRIEATPKQFRMVDNCGGISVDLARNYAFRFGRPEGMPSTPHSVGQFGVGMKRALFKLGSKFTIESTTKTSRFVVEEDVNEWKARKKWQFHFKELETNLKNVPPNKRGTKITVAPLHESVAEDFGLDNFINRLRHEVRQAHQQTMNRGLTISLNGIPLEIHPLELLYSDELKPAFLEKKLSQNDGFVDVKVYAGISQSTPKEAGWYIYCNGRMIMEANQTLTTGWGEGDGRTIPKYHNQFSRFRGFAFFNSDAAELLPWNTTKTGVDADSPIFRAVRQEMITLARPVIDFLNALDAEKVDETDYQPLTYAVANARNASVTEVPTSSKFVAPKPRPRPSLPRAGRIQYNKPLDKIEKIKKVLKVSSYTAVGEKTFDYFYERECED